MAARALSCQSAKMKQYNFKRRPNRRLTCVGERPPGLGHSKQGFLYATAEDLISVIRRPAQVRVMDDKSKQEITAATLFEIVADLERRCGPVMNAEFLRELIRLQGPQPLLPGFLEHTLRYLIEEPHD
jgi:polyhydroxyalkanoate synthesis regulator protein